MDIGPIARRYARALLLFAAENGHENKVMEQVKTLLAHYTELPLLRRTLENPMVDVAEKASLLRNATAGQNTCEELDKFFMLVLENKREKMLVFMLHSFLFLYRKEKKIRESTLITAVPLPEKTIHELKKMILARYGGRTVEFNTKIDPSIIGGGILDIGYRRFDASVAGQLKRVKKQFIEKNRRIV